MERPKNDECYTPQWVFDAMGLRFDLDVAAPIDRTRVSVPGVVMQQLLTYLPIWRL